MLQHLGERGFGYAIAVTATAITVLARVLLTDVLGEAGPLLAFILPVLLAAWFGGLGPGLVATALCGTAGWYFFVERHGWAIPQTGDRVRLALFLLVGVAISVVNELNIRARRLASQKRREAERSDEAVWARQRQLQLVTDHAPVLIAHCDSDRRFKFVNKAYAARFGLTPRDIVGRRIADVVGEEAYQSFQQYVDLALAGQRVEFEVTVPYEKTGPQHMRCAYQPEFDASGRVVGLVAAIVNITDRKLAEQLLRESEAQFRLLADNAPAMLWLTDANAACTYLSRQWYEYTGRTSEQDLGLGWLDNVHPDDLPAANAVLLDAHWRHVAFRLDYRLRRHDGEYRWAIDTGRPRFGAAGEFLGFVGCVIDVHERKVYEEALKESDRRKDEFLATLAHELRNPLNPIRASLEVLRRAGDNLELLEQARATMHRQMNQMVRLLDDLLDVSRITRGKVELRKERVELSAVLREAVESARPFLETAGHELIVALPAESVVLDADPARLAQVFLNLLNNAAKYTEPGGRIWLTAEIVDGGGWKVEGKEAAGSSPSTLHPPPSTTEVTVSVRDTGVGVPAEKLPFLFEMFFQVDPTLERAKGGLGIGLTLVRRLVEMHGGTVTAHSAGRGRGSEFVVRLPVGRAEEKPLVLPSSAFPLPPSEALRPLPPAFRSSPHSRRILVVDDNQDSAASLAMLLRLAGNEVHTAHDGPEAVAAAATLQPEVVVLDIGLPTMNGYEAARRIREQPGGTAVALVALTGWGQEEDKRRAREAGFDAHLTKPVDPEALMPLVASLGRPASG